MWPLALANIVHEDDDTTTWAWLHARQALVFGSIASVAFFVVLAFPLVAVLAIPSISTGTTIAVYAAGLAVDTLAVVLLLLLAWRYAGKAARGDLFSIPVVTAIVHQWFRSEPP